MTPYSDKNLDNIGSDNYIKYLANIGSDNDIFIDNTQ